MEKTSYGIWVFSGFPKETYLRNINTLGFAPYFTSMCLLHR